jgi:cytochrome c oxidase subunit 2
MAPLNYLSGASAKAAPVVALTWGVLAISVFVIAAIGILLAVGIWRRPGLQVEPGTRNPVEEGQGGERWLWVGVGLSSLALLMTVVWTVKVLAKIQTPGAEPAITVEVTGRQWWWQVRYLTGDPSQTFVTANEIHIPTNQPVRLKLVGGDVIHSFWVPQLAGKMDAVPGQINETWIDAEHPGIYAGQCTEYCGVQHSNMGARVIAQPPSEFREWREHQLVAPRGRSPEFVQHCGNCHAVRGTDAKGTFGPDLSHLMQRQTLAAGALPNDEAALSRWIADPQVPKPGNRMPTVRLSAEDHKRIVAWLRTLF